jgi:hypothetical protein
MENYKQINIKIPLQSKPNYNDDFTLEENFLMLEIGLMAVLSMKKEMFGMKEQDKEKIKSELNEYYKNEINNLTITNMVVKKEYGEIIDKQKEELERKMSEINQSKIEIEKQKIVNRFEIEKELQKKYEGELERNKADIEKEVIKRLDIKVEYVEIANKQLNNKIAELQDEMKRQKKELEELREKEKDGYKKEIKQNMEEREKSNKVMVQLNEKLEEIKKNNNYAKNKGNDGEKEFYDLAMNTFRDFKDFEIINKSKVAHMGDFHMVFENFIIMVDCKKYTNGVGSTNRDKLKRDLNNNKNIQIAWMVSLDSHNDKFGKYPFMIDNIDIQHGICICYINSLLKQPNPEELLKIVWFTCELLYNNVLKKDDEELNDLKKNKKQITEIAKQLNDINKNQFKIIAQLEDDCQKTNELLKQLLTNEITKIRENEIEFVREWWGSVSERKTGETLKSSIIHDLFKRQNEDYRITEDGFKMILETIIEPENVVKQKAVSSPLKIKNYRLKVLLGEISIK